MKLGTKIFNLKDRVFLDMVVDKIEFIETMAIETEDYDFLKIYGKKIVLHAEHQEFGINPADKSKQEDNLAAIKFALKIADKLKVEKIITHPGVLEDENCTEENAISFFRDIKDKRIVIENLPLVDYTGQPLKALCSTPGETKEFLKKTNKKFCFDFSHAILSALVLKRDNYNEFIKPYLKLSPSHFHFSDITLREFKDHLNLGEGNLNIGYYKKLIPKDAEVTLETGTNYHKILNDIKIMRA